MSCSMPISPTGLYGHDDYAYSGTNVSQVFVGINWFEEQVFGYDGVFQL